MFTVHQNLLFNKAPQFKKALLSPFVKAKRGCVAFKDTKIEDVHIIGTFISWLYEQHPLLYLGGSDKRQLALSKMQVFANKINIINFANDVITAIWQKRRDQGITISITTLNQIWDNTIVNLIFRKFIVHTLVKMSLSYI